MSPRQRRPPRGPLCPSPALRSPVPHLRRVKQPPRAHHDWVSLSVPVGAQHLLVENLQPDMSYQFSVLAQNKLGSGPFSQIVTSVPRGKREGAKAAPVRPPARALQHVACSRFRPAPPHQHPLSPQASQ